MSQSSQKTRKFMMTLSASILGLALIEEPHIVGVDIDTDPAVCALSNLVNGYLKRSTLLLLLSSSAHSSADPSTQ